MRFAHIGGEKIHFLKSDREMHECLLEASNGRVGLQFCIPLVRIIGMCATTILTLIAGAGQVAFAGTRQTVHFDPVRTNTPGAGEQRQVLKVCSAFISFFVLKMIFRFDK